MKPHLCKILLVLSLIWAHVYQFYPQRDWHYLSPWFGQVEQVNKYMDTGGSNWFKLELKPNQLEEWKQMLSAANIPYEGKAKGLKTTSPFALQGYSGEKINIQCLEVFLNPDHTRDDDKNFWIHFGTQDFDAPVLSIQHPEFYKKPLGIAIDVIQMLIFLSATALLTCCITPKGQAMGYIKGLGLIALIVTVLSASSCLGLEGWSSSNFANREIMISLIILGGLCNGILWSIIYPLSKREKTTAKPLSD